MSEAEKPTQPAAAAAATTTTTDAPVAEKAPETAQEQKQSQSATDNNDNNKTPQEEKEKQTENPSTDARTDAVAPAVDPVAATITTTAKSPDVDAIEVKKADQKKDEVLPEDKPHEAPVDTRPEYLSKNPALSQLFEKLPTILKKADYHEMWGVTLKDSDDVPTVNVLIKFLRANEGDVKLAEAQLSKALEWRKKMDPLALAEKASFSSGKFKDLGYVATYKDQKQGDIVFTWNIYGSVKDVNRTFGDIDEFIKWRVALMEMAVKDLKLSEATSVIDYSGEDPYQMIQVHDYQNVSFLRLNPSIKSATRQTIDVFSTAYPELLKEKFFVNVPALMGWVFTALKVFLTKNTLRKFHPITNGVNLAREFTFADELPKSYGGKGGELQESARTVTLKEDTPEPSPAPESAPESGPSPQAPAATAETNGSAKEIAVPPASEPPNPAADAKPADEAPAPAAARVAASEPEKPAAPPTSETPTAAAK
ncbi:phosphatidylinositol transfer protein SFH5 [Emergomyces pasteurianus Ep9510]|uniref:Phosphatidylinositol transfer protein SFH5 n=1 Tax=Emergomyces pasteurianus Ep9510 TaxID=1447872 RepID=A0A1J9PGF0_9EURO|nr:phosphatidylinositol transfer protein SFH5 [Emergomyces pasteurianus Ep9510]